MFEDHRGKGYGRYFMSLLEDHVRAELDKDKYGLAVKKTDEVRKTSPLNTFFAEFSFSTPYKVVTFHMASPQHMLI